MRNDTVLHRMAALFVLVVAFACSLAIAQSPLGSEFTYQGQLKSGGTPLNADADFAFALFDALEGGSQIGSTLAANAVDVAGGLFAVELDFGVMAFNGDARWLEIAVRSPAGSGEFTTLSPRQLLTAAPYALQSRGLFCDEAGNIGIGSSEPDTALLTKTSEDFGGITIQTADNALSQGLRFRNEVSAYTWSIMREDMGDYYASLVFSGGAPSTFAGDLPERLRITPDGNVGIGTTNPRAMLHNAGGYYGQGNIGLHAWGGDGESGNAFLMARDDSGSSSIGLQLHTQHNGAMQDAVGISSLGDVAMEGDLDVEGSLGMGGDLVVMGATSLVGHVTVYTDLNVDGDTSLLGGVTIQNDLRVTGALYVEDLPYADRGNAQYDAANDQFYYDSSSRRYKDNITPLADDFDKLLVAEPRTYTRPGKPDRWEIGYIAEEFADLGLERLVYYDEDGAPFGVNYSKLPLYITQIVKGHRARLEAKDAEIAKQQRQIDELTARMQRIESLLNNTKNPQE